MSFWNISYASPSNKRRPTPRALTRVFFFLFFLSGFSFTDTDDSQDSRGREGTIYYSTPPLPPEHGDIYLQLCMWDDYHVFLIAKPVFTRLLLDEIYHFIELPFDWLINDAMFLRLLDEQVLGFCYIDFYMGNRWIWTCLDYHALVLEANRLTKCGSHPEIQYFHDFLFYTSGLIRS